MKEKYYEVNVYVGGNHVPFMFELNADEVDRLLSRFSNNRNFRLGDVCFNRERLDAVEIDSTYWEDTGNVDR